MSLNLILNDGNSSQRGRGVGWRDGASIKDDREIGCRHPTGAKFDRLHLQDVIYSTLPNGDALRCGRTVVQAQPNEPFAKRHTQHR